VVVFYSQKPKTKVRAVSKSHIEAEIAAISGCVSVGIIVSFMKYNEYCSWEPEIEIKIVIYSLRICNSPASSLV
jgi:hypothetical protein